MLDHATPAQSAQQKAVERRNTAEQGPAQQNPGAEGQLEQTQTGFGNRVVGRFLVCTKAHGVGKICWQLAAMPRDMTDLAGGQPKSEQQAGQQGQGKAKSEAGGEFVGRAGI